MKGINRVISLFSIFIIQFVLLTVTSFAATCNPADTVALKNALADVNCDIINLNAGTYLLTSGTFSPNHNVVINGQGQGVTFLDGNNSHRVFYNGGFTVTFSNLTVRNGNANPGAGLNNDVGGSMTLQNVTVSGNNSNNGAGILNNSVLMIYNSVISGNTASGSGGGIYNLGTTLIDNSTLSGNGATSGGGISNEGNITINKSDITGNTATALGGGIYTDNGVINIDCSNITGNTPTDIENAGGTVNITNNCNNTIQSPVSVNAAGEVIVRFTDGRLGDFGNDAVLYTPANGGIQVYGVDGGSAGWLGASVSDEEIANLSCPPDQNIEIGTSNDSRYHIYYLTSCQFQVNMGPFGTDGKVYEAILDVVPTFDIIQREFYTNR